MDTAEMSAEPTRRDVLADIQRRLSWAGQQVLVLTPTPGSAWMGRGCSPTRDIVGRGVAGKLPGRPGGDQ
jgi:hypothetical protein